jgi:NAD(P)-dependent dehydrogenase (short-subunit alcohol dehydrogenase family)
MGKFDMIQPSNPFDFTGQVVLVTGAAKGIGAGIAQQFAAFGATVCLAVRTPESIEPTRAAMGDGAPGHLVFAMDISDARQIERGFAMVEKQLGRLDVLVNNAGDGSNASALDETAEQFDRIMNTNVRGTFLCSQAAGRMMVPRKYGRIINIGSQAGVVAIANHTAYSASKGAIHMMTKVMALEWAPHGVTVNTVAPTFIQTPGTRERLENPAFRKAVLDRIPAGRVGTIDDVAYCTCFLASRAAGLITGEILLVDGGWTIQ